MLRSLITTLRRDQRGGTAIEYGLIAAVISLAAIGAFRTLATANNAQWNNSAAQFAAASAAANAAAS